MKLRKRTFIAVLITVFTLVATNQFWLIRKPITVEMDVIGNGKINIDAILNKKDNDEFSKVRQGNQTINLSKDKHVVINVKNIKHPKRLKLAISNLDKNKEIILKNISLKNGQYKLANPDNINLIGGGYRLEQNSLIITPQENSIQILYKTPLKVRASTSFELEIFTIIAVLMFLLSYKLTNYVADFKTVQEKSRIEILFLTIFFLFLFVPMSYINQDVRSNQENRTLAKWKPLINKDKTINYNFGKDFDNWFSDRFNLRMLLVNSYSSIKVLLTNRNDKGIVDKNGMIYRNLEFNHLTNEEIEIAFDAIEKFDDFCKQNNIKLYTLIVPQKADIHQTTLNYSNNEKSSFDKFNKRLSQATSKGKTILFPLEIMKNEAKNNYMFFKTDHHWTDDGAFIGYKELMNEINKDFANINTQTEKDFEFFYDKKVRSDFDRRFHNGQSCSGVGLSKGFCKKLIDVNYKYFKHKKQKELNVKTLKSDKQLAKEYFFPSGANYKVLLFGTSQCENLSEFIPYTFKHVLRERTNSVFQSAEEYKIIKHFGNRIIEYKPDILIFCIAYYQLKYFDKMFLQE